MNNMGPIKYLSWYVKGLKWPTIWNLYKEKYLLLTLRTTLLKPPEFPRHIDLKESCWFTFSSFDILTSLSTFIPLFSGHVALKTWPTACCTTRTCIAFLLSQLQHWSTIKKNHHNDWGSETAYPNSQVPAILWPNNSSSPQRNPSLCLSSCLK